MRSAISSRRWAASSGARLGVPLSTHIVPVEGSDPGAESWLETYRISGAVAVLVRPDGFIAWRSEDMVSDPVSAVREVCEAVLGR